MPKPTYRNHRNSPYALDRAFAAVHHSAAGAAWRFRTELATLAATLLALGELARLLAIAQAALILTAVMAAALAVPASRRFVVRRAWCVLARHRIQKVFFETRMHTRSGRLSLVLWIRPTDVGERAWIWCRAGICFEDFEAHTGEIAAACLAREARVERSRRWAQLVWVDVVRRDTLAAHTLIRPALAPKPDTQRDQGDTAA